MAHADREIVENALSPDMVEEIWSGNYEKVLPVTLLDFELSAVLPAVFYMFRFGHRRGVGNFLATYGPPSGTPAQKRRQTTVDRIAAKLTETDGLAGFDGDVEQAILGRSAALLLSRERPAPTRPGSAGAARRADPLPGELDRSAQ